MPDLNLLMALDVLLAEGSVAGAARRLNLSPSAMSRTLTRLRQVTSDPLLVRAGRGLVPPPRAIQLRAQVGPLVESANALLRPAETLDLTKLQRRFTLRTSEGFAETFGPRLLGLVQDRAAGVTLQFMTKPDKESAPLREGEVDIETGVIDLLTAPELRAVSLFDDRWVGVVRADHPLAKGAITNALFAAQGHVMAVSYTHLLHRCKVEDPRKVEWANNEGRHHNCGDERHRDEAGFQRIFAQRL